MDKGIVLAGGKSSRFGEDKALAVVGGEKMIERTIRLVEALGLEPAVITSSARDYGFLGCRVEKDFVPERGPLGGIYTACRLFKSQSLLVLTCDMPQVTLSLLKCLKKNHDGGRRQATVFRSSSGEVHPFPGVYESSLAGFILSEIENQDSPRERLSMLGFLKRLPNVTFLESPFPLSVFSSVNRKEDLP